MCLSGVVKKEICPGLAGSVALWDPGVAANADRIGFRRSDRYAPESGCSTCGSSLRALAVQTLEVKASGGLQQRGERLYNSKCTVFASKGYKIGSFFQSSISIKLNWYTKTHIY